MPAEGHGEVTAGQYGRAVRLNISGGRALGKGHTVLLPPAEAVKLLREVAAAIEAIIKPTSSEQAGDDR
ncbi:hypothetical protein MMB17_18680 [Methylobacterium organophilum]|uniref:hypothetical protein n=1 Tax=Methylobacterium organophilum TaxID=410 RepID=UPI001F13E1B5|nr:hypothetical protein [Methylobacterium organophilum]UMY16689.1 hypothetical protein MMB17_18680 [Methylobacterium organophilum]